MGASHNVLGTPQSQCTLRHPCGISCTWWSVISNITYRDEYMEWKTKFTWTFKTKPRCAQKLALNPVLTWYKFASFELLFSNKDVYMYWGGNIFFQPIKHIDSLSNLSLGKCRLCPQTQVIHWLSSSIEVFLWPSLKINETERSPGCNQDSRSSFKASFTIMPRNTEHTISTDCSFIQ